MALELYVVHCLLKVQHYKNKEFQKLAVSPSSGKKLRKPIQVHYINLIFVSARIKK
jgi:hypothetical protein